MLNLSIMTVQSCVGSLAPRFAWNRVKARAAVGPTGIPGGPLALGDRVGQGRDRTGDRGHTKTTAMCHFLNGVAFDRQRFEGPTAAPLRAHGAYFLGKLRKVTSPPL